MITIYFEGGAKPNPGIGYGSWEIIDDCSVKPEPVRGSWKSPFTTLPNNRAEYLTLWLALCQFRKMLLYPTKLMICSDSKLPVKQLTGRWRVRDPKIKRLHAFVLREIHVHFYEWDIVWNPREVNVEKFGH